MKKTILIYGAGKNAEYLATSPDTDQEVKEIFKQAVAFIDKDVAKQGRAYMGKRVMSPKDAYNLYPAAEIYFSLLYNEHIYGEIYEELCKQGFQPSNFINCRKTCNYLEYFVVCGYHEAAFGGKVGTDIGTHSFKPCCSDYGKNQVDFVKIGDDLQESFKKYIELKKNLLDKLKNNEKCCCTGCPYVFTTNQDVSNEFEYIIFNEMGRCNCKCVYCNYSERLGRDILNDVDMVELYQLVKEFGYNKENGIVELCNGEITIHPDKKRIYECLKDTNIMFLTNGIVYDDEIKKRMLDGTAKINISLDSGTPETFFRVKGVNCFEAVVRNLNRYAQDKRGKIILKYIFIPDVNDEISDIEGFVDICKEIQVEAVHISYDLTREYKEYFTAKMLNAFRRLIDLLKEENISFEIYSKVLENAFNAELIKEGKALL